MPRLTHSFFARDTLTVARDLLGCILVRVLEGKRVAGRIVEVEAYVGEEDQACHGHRGRTPRNAVMFGPAGISYIYFIYGMYWLFNVVAKPSDLKDYPAAVLIRALEPVEGLDLMQARRIRRPQAEWTSGPGRLTMALEIDGSLNGIDLSAPGSPLFFEVGETIPDDRVLVGPRVGLKIPEPWQNKPWRFRIADSDYVSRGN